MAQRLYIKVDGENNYIGNPSLESNLRMVFRDHDFEQGPPEGYMLFERVPCPVLGVYETFENTIGEDLCAAYADHNGLSYEIVDGVYKDVWHTRDMTADEKLAKQTMVQSEFAAVNPTWTSWTFNETICDMEPPTPCPTDGNIYEWSESTLSWVQYPTDGQNYNWDYDNETWVLLT